MKYVGGKNRIAKEIIEKIGGGTTLVSLFCGGCAVEGRITTFDNLIINDKHPYLMAMWQGLYDGTFDPPENVSEEEYKWIRAHLDENPALSGFVGFGCSFAGKWWGGYARNKKGENFAKETRNSTLKAIENMTNRSSLTLLCGDYKDVELPHGSVIYADPPYEGTMGYKGVAFDSGEFWDYAREVSKEHKMFISEMQAPPDFVAIWEKDLARYISHKEHGYDKATEKLFLHERWLQ